MLIVPKPTPHHFWGRIHNLRDGRIYSYTKQILSVFVNEATNDSARLWWHGNTVCVQVAVGVHVHQPMDQGSIHPVVPSLFTPRCTLTQWKLHELVTNSLSEWGELCTYAPKSSSTECTNYCYLESVKYSQLYVTHVCPLQRTTTAVVWPGGINSIFASKSYLFTCKILVFLVGLLSSKPQRTNVYNQD